jgi:hypothetical protein
MQLIDQMLDVKKARKLHEQFPPPRSMSKVLLDTLGGAPLRYGQKDVKWKMEFERCLTADQGTQRHREKLLTPSSIKSTLSLDTIQ